MATENIFGGHYAFDEHRMGTPVKGTTTATANASSSSTSSSAAEDLSLSAINKNTTQPGKPQWFNNPKRRNNPGIAVKREAVELDSDSFITKKETTAPGFKSLAFGTRRSVDTSRTSAFSDELPPLRTMLDLQREDGEVLSNQNINANQSLNQSMNMSHPAPDSVLPKQFTNLQPQQFAQQQQQPKEESAVLVFGYPESISTIVIQHFAKFGQILEDFEIIRMDPLFHKPSAKQYPIFTGNGWIKLTYDNKASAMRALEESGSVLHGSMIGCVPYTKHAIENIASISITSFEDVGVNTMHSTDDVTFGNRRKIVPKSDEKIFIRKDTKKIKYSGLSIENQKKGGLLSVVNNWLFGWEDL